MPPAALARYDMYEKITLENGVRIVFENIPYVRSVSAGIWVGSGSRFEKASENGASHFIEHMVFKGTETRSASDLAVLMDSIGGQVNAYTTKDCTCFYGRVLDTHLHMLTDILCDMLFCSKFDDDDVVNERGVIFEEIDMYADSPDDLVSERLFAEIYRGSSLSRPILGKKSTLRKMDGAFLKDYMRRHYNPKNIVIALSGSFRREDIDYLAERFSVLEAHGENKLVRAEYTPSFTAKKKPIEQNHICIAFPGITASDDRRYAMQILSTVLGGGMASRLFQSVREKLGLCYTIYSFNSSYDDIGTFGIYTALGQDTENRAIEVIKDELRRVYDNGITELELSRTREQAKSNILMGLESTGTRMNRLGRGELTYGCAPDTDELMARYDAVTLDDVHRLARDCFDFSKSSLSAVGRVKPADEYRELMLK